LALAAVGVTGFLFLLIVDHAEAGRGSVRHGSQKGARRGAERGAKVVYSRTGTDQGAARGATKGAARGASRGAQAGVAADPRTGPGRGSSRAGYRRGYHHGRWHAWEDARRDYRRWRAFTGVLRLGVYYSTRPRYSTTVVVTGTTYYYAGGVYYVQSGNGYVVTSAPPGAVVYAVPTYTTVVYVDTAPYYYANGTYYVQTDAPAEPPPQEAANVTASMDSADDEHAGVESVEMTDDEENYEVVAPPVGATVPYLPDEAEEETLGGKTYFVYAETWYKPFVSDGDTIYMVVEDPRQA
jgi:hypothetical protein